MLQAREQVPHFTVTGDDGATISYDQIWQRQPLLLVLIDGRERVSSREYVKQLREHMADLTAHDTACVVTPDAVPGAPSPGVVIADRWGEIWYVHHADSNAALPAPDALIEWLRYVQMQCPECGGETR